MNKKVIGLVKDELEGRIVIESFGLRPKTHSYLMNDDSEHKKSKETNKCVIKRRRKFNDYKNCLFKNKITVKLQQDCAK